MENTWDLTVLYSGYDDPKYQEDFNNAKKIIEECVNFANNLANYTKKDGIEAYLNLEEEMNKNLADLFIYSNLRSSTNVNDMKALEEIGKLQFMMQDTVSLNVEFGKFLLDADIDNLSLESKLIKKYAFHLNEIKENAKHLLSDKEEVLAAKLSMVGSNSWSDLQSKLTSNLLISIPGHEDSLPLSSIRNMAYSHNKEERKNAYIAEINAYKNIEDSVAMALNNIKREVNIMIELRGYENALDKTLKQSRMSKKALDAMIDAIKEEAPQFRKYFKLKAKALGYDNGLPFYELFAPMGDYNKTYTFDEARDLVLEVYGSFSKPLEQMGYEAFSERWIDVLPHEGKVGGAFCAGLPNQKVSRVLTNFTGGLGDVQTLAHELGHAYHGKIIFENPVLYQDYPMPLAETASIFCQTLMAKKMINDMDNKKDKLTVLEESLQEDSQCIIDILSRYLFETMVLETPVEKPLSAKELCDMMLKAQDLSYGDGLDSNYKHPYMWICKSHYYSAGLNYYNWPYAFGLLFGKGLYKKYLDNKEEFVSRYDDMLRKTGYMSVSDVAKTMDIDIENKDFWLESLRFIEEDITLFEELLNEEK